MKKTLILVLALICLFDLAGCDRNRNYDVKLTIPAGPQDGYVYSGEELSPVSGRVTVSTPAELGETEVVLLNGAGEIACGPVRAAPLSPVTLEVSRGEWYRLGVSVPRPLDSRTVVYVSVKGVELRIA